MKLDRKGLDRASFMLFVQSNRDAVGSNSDWWAWTHELTTRDRKSWRDDARELLDAYFGRNPRTGKWDVAA